LSCNPFFLLLPKNMIYRYINPALDMAVIPKECLRQGVVF